MRALIGNSLSVIALLILQGVTLPSILAEAPSGAMIGIAKEAPESGPSVKVDGGYMIPYGFNIPGTDVLMEMIPVPGGTFMFGSPENEADRRDDEGPQIKVTVDPMWVGKTEVNWRQYKEYMSLYTAFKEFETRGVRKVTDSNRVDAITAPTPLYEPTFTYEYGEDPGQPAVTMTQYAAQQFTKWLSRLTGSQYRLPTEAEWEYAARGGTTTAYSWGDDPDDLDDHAWNYDNADSGPELVGTKKPNPFGLFDMHGNAAEWTVNQYTENGYQDFAGKQDLKGTDMVVWPITSTSCVVRGGSWEMEAIDLRSAARTASDDEAWKDSDPNFPLSPWWFTDDPSRGVGFRVFRSYKPLDPATIARFWEVNAEDAKSDIQSRLLSGRGGLGVVDQDLPEAVKKLAQ